MDEFLTVADVAQLLKLNQQTVRNWIDEGRVPAVRVGRRVRIRRVDLDAVLAESQTAPSPDPNASTQPPPLGFWEGGRHADPIPVDEIS